MTAMCWIWPDGAVEAGSALWSPILKDLMQFEIVVMLFFEDWWCNSNDDDAIIL